MPCAGGISTVLRLVAWGRTSVHVFVHALFERWAQQSEAAAARTKLHYLRQDRNHIQDPMALYALIPFDDPTSVDVERDKLYRFFYHQLQCSLAV